MCRPIYTAGAYLDDGPILPDGTSGVNGVKAIGVVGRTLLKLRLPIIAGVLLSQIHTQTGNCAIESFRAADQI